MLHSLKWGTYYMWEKQGMYLTGFIILVFLVLLLLFLLAYEVLT